MIADVRPHADLIYDPADFGSWANYFRSNIFSPTPIPWNDTYRLSEAEKQAVSRSIQQFQLGEGSDGHHFRQCAEAFCARNGESSYPEAQSLFIAEEQRHSADLGRFMERQGIPLLEKHWVDGTFRRLRKLAGLEICAFVLVTAEIIAVPYYHALRGATESPLLRALCTRILRDEAAHLQFQAETLAMIRGPRGKCRAWLLTQAHSLFLLGAVLVVWQQHRAVFRHAGYTLRDFCRESYNELDGLIRSEAEAARRRSLPL
jgi:hypothetical protein